MRLQRKKAKRRVDFRIGLIERKIHVHTIIKEFPFGTYLKRAAHLRLQGTERSRIIRLGNPARGDMAYRIANE